MKNYHITILHLSKISETKTSKKGFQYKHVSLKALVEGLPTYINFIMGAQQSNANNLVKVLKTLSNKEIIISSDFLTEHEWTDKEGQNHLDYNLDQPLKCFRQIAPEVFPTLETRVLEAWNEN